MNKSLIDIEHSCTSHNKENIVLICLNKECEQNRLCCIYCAEQQHKKHQIISLRKFENLMKLHLQQNNHNPQKVKISKLFEEAQKKLIKNLKDFEITFLSTLQTIESRVQQIFRQIHLSFNLPYHSDLIAQIDENFTNQMINQFLKGINICSEFKIGNASTTQKVIQKQIGFMNSKIEQCSKQISTKVKGLLGDVDNLNFVSKKNEEPYYYHPTFKHNELNIRDVRNIVENVKNIGNRLMALTHKPLSPVNNCIKFKVLEEGNGTPSIVLGVAVLSIVRQQSFSSCIGFKRGIYAIDQSSAANWGSIQPSAVAYSWNHDLQAFSNTVTSLKIGKGTIISIEILFNEKTIQFSIETQGQQDQEDQNFFTMPIDISHRDLFPFVSLLNTGSCVQIVE